LIILLNGTSSSGKSTLAKYLLKAFDVPFIYHSFDSLVPALLPHADSFDPIKELGSKSYIRKLDADLYQRIDESGLSIIDACYQLIPILANRGFNIIVDTIFWPGVMQSFLELLNDFQNVYIVGIHCPLDELKRREKARQNRREGNAEAQFNKLHLNMQYDVEIDTDQMTYGECCLRIINHIKNNGPAAMDILKRKCLNNGEHPRC
jgi:chloramphenicol 3-O phosphotransferase